MYFKNTTLSNLGGYVAIGLAVLLLILVYIWTIKLLIDVEMKTELYVFIVSTLATFITVIWNVATPAKSGYTSLSSILMGISLVAFVPQYIFYGFAAMSYKTD